MATIVNDLISYLQCGSTIAANDAIYIDDITGKISKYDPLNPALVFAGIAKEAGVLDDFIRVVQSGRIKGFSALTPGQFVYASTTVPGSFQLVEPIPSQKVILGIAKSATELTINGGLGIKPGGEGGGGGLDAFYIEDMEGLADPAGFSKGNDAAFLGGGTFQGTLALDEIAPISATKSLVYTQAAGSLNDYFASELIDLDPKQRDNTSGMTFYFEYDGADNDGRFVVYDVTNSQEIASEVNFVKLASKSTRYSLSFYVPASCTQIQWGYQVLVENVGAQLIVDDVEMSTNPFVSVPQPEQGGIYSTNSTTTGTVNLNTNTSINANGIFSVSGDTVTALKKCSVNASIYNLASSTAAGQQVNVSLTYKGVVIAIDLSRAGASAQGMRASASASLIMQPGETLIFSQGGDQTPSYAMSMVATASTSHILTPSDTFSTDTAPLTYANAATYTLSTLANAPIGTYITFTYAANGNTRTQTTGTNRPTQTDADMNQNGIQIFTRAYNAASTAGNPAAIAIQIGKGLKGKSLDLYKSAGKVIAGSLDYLVFGTDSASRGVRLREYEETTGILTLDAGLQENTNITNALLRYTDTSTQNNGYLTINASRSLPLLAVPVPLTAYLKDVKPPGTAGGTFTAGGWRTRTLNTVEGDGSIVSLSGSQFQLGPGKYEIEASAPAFTVNRHQSKLRNITTSTDTSIGSSEFSGGAEIVVTKSHIASTVVLTTSTIFELQHTCQTTRVGDGFGLTAFSGVDDLFSIVKIKKVG